MSKKFHINSAGDVRPCNAEKRACRFGESEHFDDKNEAQKEVETRLEKEASGAELKGHRKSHNLKAKNRTVFASELLNYARSFTDPTPSDFRAIGEKFDEELSKRVDFNLFDHELTLQERKDVEKATFDLYNEIAVNDKENPVETIGTLSKQLNEAIKIVPNSVKYRLGDMPIATKVIPKSSRVRDGGYTQGQVERYVEAVTSVSSFRVDPNAPNGSMMTVESYTESEISHPRSGFRCFIKNGDSVKDLKTVWVGQTPRKKGFRKISDTSKVWLNGREVELETPTYSMVDTETFNASVIMSKKTSDKTAMKSILLHEYCHAIQYRSNLSVKHEEALIDELAGDTAYSLDYNVRYYKGFPDEYMGNFSRKEVLPVATEGFFYPSQGDRKFFYGSDRGENADNVRKWVAGFWVKMASLDK